MRVAVRDPAHRELQLPPVVLRLCRGTDRDRCGLRIAGTNGAQEQDDECDALVTGADAGWSESDRVLIDAVDELERTGSWSESTWSALGADLDDEQRMELLVAVGWYRTICTLCNGLALPVEGWMRRWPASDG